MYLIQFLLIKLFIKRSFEKNSQKNLINIYKNQLQTLYPFTNQDLAELSNLTAQYFVIQTINIQRKNMYRSHHHPSFQLEYCIILQNRLPLVYVPKSFTTYFINSKRRFFLYLKYQDQLEQLVKIFERQNVKFYQRKSIFPDRQENEEIVYHCNYKYLKKDLRWTLRPESKPRQPKFRFNQNKNDNKFSLFDSKSSKNIYSSLDAKTDEINRIQSFSKIQSQQQLEPLQVDIQKIEIQQPTAPELVADFGEIKIRNPQVLDIINNFQLMKALFKSQKRR